jgi:hypothetical protein
MAKLAYYVHVEDDKGEPHVFGPEDTVPNWAAKKITNDSAWVDGEADSGSGDTSEESGVGDEPVPYAKRKKADLEAEVASRNEGREDDDLIVVEGKGTVADLAAALEADDAAQADS